MLFSGEMIMRSVLLVCLLCIASIVNGEELDFDWELLNSNASIQEKYDHIITTDYHFSQAALNSKNLLDYASYYFRSLDHGKNTQKISLLKAILAKFSEADPVAKTVLGTIYHAESSKIYSEFIKENPNAINDDKLTYLEKYHTLIYSDSAEKGNKLYQEACESHEVRACMWHYFSVLEYLKFCGHINDGNIFNCGPLIQKVASAENKVLSEAIFNYENDDDPSLKPNYAYMIFGIYRHGISPLSENYPEIQKQFGFTRDAKKAELWKKRAEKYIKQHNLEDI